LGIVRLAKKHGDARVEQACARCLAVNARSYRSVETVLKHNLDAQPLPSVEPDRAPIEHENVRGPDYFIN